MKRGALHAIYARVVACGARTVLYRAATLAAGWWILTEGEPAALGFGSITVLAALVVGLWLPSQPSPRWHPLGVVRFALVFVLGAVRGGVDVAHRALSPGLPIAPHVVEYALRLPDGAARNLFLGTVTVMPGSLAVTCEGPRLEVHVLASRSAFVQELAALEEAVARAVGERLEGPHA